MLLFSRPVAGEEPSLKPNFDASAGSETAISVSTRRDVAPTVRDDVVVQSATRDAATPIMRLYGRRCRHVLVL
jgi:hypothetical protein